MGEQAGAAAGAAAGSSLAWIGQLAEGLGTITKTIGDNVNIGWKTFNERLKNENTGRKDWFAKFRTDYTQLYLILALAIVGLVAVVLVILAIKQNK